MTSILRSCRCLRHKKESPDPNQQRSVQTLIQRRDRRDRSSTHTTYAYRKMHTQTKGHTNNTQTQKRRTSRPNYHKPASIFIKFPNLKAQTMTRIHSAITKVDYRTTTDYKNTFLQSQQTHRILAIQKHTKRQRTPCWLTSKEKKNKEDENPTGTYAKAYDSKDG